MKISFEIEKAELSDGEFPEVIEIHLDKDGRNELVDKLLKLGEDTDHFHLFADSWGVQDDLCEKPTNPLFACAKHVKIQFE